jgi:hypothetical protein
MRLMFVYYALIDQGSGLVIQGYTEAAKALGHEVVVYGVANPWIPLNYSLDVRSADAVIFIFEFTTYMNRSRVDPLPVGAGGQGGDGRLDYVRLLETVPRRRRVIIDGDGKYNDVLSSGDDSSHPDAEAARQWIEICDSLSDKICQPTLHPVRPNVLPFLFYAYHPAWARPLDFAGKDFGMIYVGHSKFRWLPMLRVLQAIEPIRDDVGRIGLVGYGWDALPTWASRLGVEASYATDPAYLNKLNVEVLPSVPFREVIPWMGKALFNPVLLRPLFTHLWLVTPRLFETLAADTIPLFAFGRDHAQEIYGPAAEALVLDGAPHDLVRRLISRPADYGDVVVAIRRHLEEQHSHAARLRRLIEIVES